ncbi:hypothetical protein [Gracilibacillus sp. YIM 98692]|uniref:hypothetical protein n=1 Tax=Gracilibacillus sp. YIM 98692 TaxID=2663532 RepID=UPI0013D79D38|nr:hypothetical protein [Gracilibacillus sp. YIM 98692]
MLEIEEFEYDSLMHSISNLATIKALYDLGCDIPSLPVIDFYDDVQNGRMQAFEILEAGRNEYLSRDRSIGAIRTPTLTVLCRSVWVGLWISRSR